MADPFISDPTSEPSAPWQPDPWSNADDLTLQRLNTGVADVRTRQANGLLDEETAGELMGKLETQRQPLIRRQQQSQAEAQQKAVQQAVHQNAIQKAIQLQDQQADTNNFQTWTDPETGAKFFQHKPGQWTNYKPPPDPNEAMDSDTATGLAETPEPELKANLDGTHTLTIQNGANRSETIYAPDPNSPSGWSMKGRQDFDANGQPIRPGTPQEAGLLQSGVVSQAEIDRVRGDASRAAGQEPQRMVVGPHGRPIPNPEHVAWANEVNRMTSHELDRIRQSREAQRREGAADTSFDRKQAARTAAKNSDEHAVKWQDNVTKTFDKAVSGWEKKNENQDMPADTRRQLLDQAKAHADELHKSAYGFVPQARQNELLGHENEDAPEQVVQSALRQMDPAKMLKQAKDQAALENPAEAGANPKPKSYWDRVERHLEGIKRGNSQEAPNAQVIPKHKSGPQPTPANPDQETAAFTKDDAGELAKLMERKRQLAQEKAAKQPGFFSPSPGYQSRVK